MSEGVSKKVELELISAATYLRLIGFILEPCANRNRDIPSLPIIFYDDYHGNMKHDLSEVPLLSKIPGVKRVNVDVSDVLKRKDIPIFRECSFESRYLFNKGYKILNELLGNPIQPSIIYYPNGQTPELYHIHRLALLTDIASILLKGVEKIDGLYVINDKDLPVPIPPLEGMFGDNHRIRLELDKDAIKDMPSFKKFIEQYKYQNQFFWDRAETLEKMLKTNQPPPPIDYSALMQPHLIF